MCDKRGTNYPTEGFLPKRFLQITAVNEQGAARSIHKQSSAAIQKGSVKCSNPPPVDPKSQAPLLNKHSGASTRSSLFAKEGELATT